MSRDGYVPLATLLTPEEAGLAHQLLVEAGVDAVLEDQALSAVDPLVRLAIGGTKLLVPEADAERARALLEAAGAPGVTRGGEAAQPELPEEEWARSAAPEEVVAEPPRWLRSTAFLTAAVAFVLVLISGLLALMHRP
jgi:hypothetical protein